MLPYLKLLIRQRLAAWSPTSHVRGKNSKIKAISMVVGFILLMVMLYGMLVGIEYLLFSAFSQIREPETMLALTGVLCTLMTLIASFFYIFSELFFSKDIMFVSALPISSRNLLTAKMIRIWLGEAGIAFLIMLPVTILYGIEKQMTVWYYLKALLLTPVIPMVPIALIALLSFLLIRLSALWKRREAMTVIFSMAFVIAIMWVEMQFSMNTTDDSLNAAVMQLVLNQKSLLDMVAGFYPPIQWYIQALVKGSAATLAGGLAFILLNLASIAAVVALLGKGYQRLAIQQSEVFTRMNAAVTRRADRHGVRTPFQALYRREVREIFVVPAYAMNCLAGGVVFPVIGLVMLLGSGSGSEDFALLPIMILMIPKILVIAGATALFALTTSMNMATSTAVSREGKRHEFFRTLPVTPATQLLAKLSMGMTLNVILSVPMLVLLCVAFPQLVLEWIIAYLASLLFALTTTISSLMVDVAHPKFGWKSETEAIKQNGIAALSMFVSMAYLALCGGAFYGLSRLGVSYMNAFLILCAVTAGIAGLLFHRLTGKSAQKYILQEVQL